MFSSEGNLIPNLKNFIKLPQSHLISQRILTTRIVNQEINKLRIEWVEGKCRLVDVMEQWPKSHRISCQVYKLSSQKVLVKKNPFLWCVLIILYSILGTMPCCVLMRGFQQMSIYHAHDIHITIISSRCYWNLLHSTLSTTMASRSDKSNGLTTRKQIFIPRQI